MAVSIEGNEEKPKEEVGKKPASVPIVKEVPKETVKEYAFEHPTVKENASVSLNIVGVETVEKSFQLDNGILKFPFDEEGHRIKDLLVKERWKDKTIYGSNQQKQVKPDVEYIPVKWTFYHPDSSNDNPLTCVSALYDTDGNEHTIEFVKNVFTTEDGKIAQALLKDKFPLMHVEKREVKR